MKALGLFFYLILFVGLFGGCISTHEIAEDYQKQLSAQPPAITKAPKHTVVLILVDGLGANLFSENFEHIPGITEYFNVSNHGFPLAHSIFPSLTFPNLISLLTRTPPNQHSVIGNKMLLPSSPLSDSKLLDFETRKDLVWLNDVKTPSLIFSQLQRQGRLSASFAQSFFLGATASHSGDLPMAISYVNKDYFKIDQENLQALATLLDNTPPKEWPDFIFLHLIGVDSIAHDVGPFQPEIGKYLRKLDTALIPIFAKLQEGQRQGARVATILTADHGFMNVQYVFDLEKFISTLMPHLTLINEGRNAAIFFPESLPLRDRHKFMSRLTQKPEIELTALREGNTLFVLTKTHQWSFDFFPNLSCPLYGFGVTYLEKSYCLDELEHLASLRHLPPYAIGNLLAFMNAPQRPDALILAAPGVSFTDKYHGHHGGITQEETLVPLLLRGIKIRDNRTPAIFEILNVLNQ